MLRPLAVLLLDMLLLSNAEGTGLRGGDGGAEAGWVGDAAPEVGGVDILGGVPKRGGGGGGGGSRFFLKNPLFRGGGGGGSGGGDEDCGSG